MTRTSSPNCAPPPEPGAARVAVPRGVHARQRRHPHQRLPATPLSRTPRPSRQPLRRLATLITPAGGRRARRRHPLHGRARLRALRGAGQRGRHLRLGPADRLPRRRRTRRRHDHRPQPVHPAGHRGVTHRAQPDRLSVPLRHVPRANDLPCTGPLVVSAFVIGGVAGTGQLVESLGYFVAFGSASAGHSSCCPSSPSPSSAAPPAGWPSTTTPSASSPAPYWSPSPRCWCTEPRPAR